MKSRKLKKSELLLKLQEVFNQTGKPPLKKDFSNAVTYQRRFGSWNKALTMAGIPLNFSWAPTQVHPCLGCGNPTKNPQFCSRSCAAKTINRNGPRKEKPTKHPRPDVGNKTLQEILGHGSSRYRMVREHAKKLYGHVKTCQVCGYSKHVEVCHEPPISKFPLTTTVAEVNFPAHIHVLCPNCHWELDHPECEVKGS